MNYDRLILELMDRVSKLEGEVKELQSKLNDYSDADEEYEERTYFGSHSTDSAGRDTTKYILDGRRYGKNRLVLAVVKKYMAMHPNTSTAQLLAAFDKSLQGSLGVVRELEEVREAYTDYERRFFTSPNEVIKTTTGTCVVCTQWAIANIGNIITRAKELGIDISIVK